MTVIENLTIKSTGHKLGTWINEVEATCGTNGTKGHYHCSACGYDFDKSSNRLTSLEIPAPEHSFESGICTKCGEIESEKRLNFVLSADGDYYSVKGIGSYAATDVVIPTEYKHLPVKAIADGAFQGEKRITSVTVPEGVTEIGERAFMNCKGLTSAELPDSVTNIGYSAFEGCILLESINIPNGLISIRERTFTGCEKLSAVTLPEGLILIRSGAFAGCKSLLSIKIPKTVKNIVGEAFSGCGKLTEVTFGEDCQLSEIGENAFAMCRGLTSITIPSSVKIISDLAFDNCTGLTEINYNAECDSTVSCTAFTWAGASGDGVKVTVTIGANVTHIPKNLFANSYITDVVFESGSTCQSIGAKAFYDCERLTSIEIPDSVTKIGNQAFWLCYGLKSVKIGSGVTTIGSDVFLCCRSLTSLTVADENTSYYVDSGCLYETATGKLVWSYEKHGATSD